MSATRRDFLRASLAAPLVFELAGCARAPAWFFDALQAMRKEGKPGLVFRVPADAKRRCSLGHELAWLVERTDVAGLEVTLQAVLLCMEDAALRRWIDGARDGDDVILVDGEGQAQAGAVIDRDKDFATQAADLLEGTGLARLRARASTEAAPALLLRYRESSDPAAEPAIRALAPPVPRLPYGASLAAGSMSACKENPACPAGMGCGACGMAIVTPRSQAFVKFLAV